LKGKFFSSSYPICKPIKSKANLGKKSLARPSDVKGATERNTKTSHSKISNSKKPFQANKINTISRSSTKNTASISNVSGKSKLTSSLKGPIKNGLNAQYKNLVK
jgi:hypothetical protein